MKANEAPEKIYLERILCSNEVYDNWKPQKTISDDIEYVRKDTLIEKACEFIDKKANFYRYHYVGEEHECDMVDTRKFIEDFKKAMEEWL